MADDTTPNDDPSATDDPDQPDPDEAALRESGRRALSRERQARRQAESKAADLEQRLRQLEDKDKPEVARLTSEVENLRQQLSTAQADALRWRVALEHKLTKSQAKRLVGSTEEELTADAEELLEDLGAASGGGGEQEQETGGSKPPPSRVPREGLHAGGEDTETPVDETDLDKIGEEMFSR